LTKKNSLRSGAFETLRDSAPSVQVSRVDAVYSEMDKPGATRV